MATVEEIKQALTNVKYPGMSRDIVSFGMVKEVTVTGGEVVLSLEMKSHDEKIEDEVCEAAKDVIQTLPGVTKIELRTSRPAGGAPKGGPAAGGPRPAGLGADPWAGRKPIRGVKNIIAVASGKGGVGKSTVATNLAVGLAKRGRQVGLLDSDIYGPSVHMMFGAMDLRPTSYDGKTLEPFLKHGVKFMSIGLLLGENTPVIWRGPMVMKMLDQFLHDVNWGDLDDLVIDLPPGTGDAQLTLVQKVPITGAVIVTTPQNVALMDAVRGLEMFKRVDVPAIGLVENMSLFACPKCGHEAHIFSHGGGAKTAQDLGIPLLAEIPLETKVREGGDTGVPVVLGDAASAPAKAFETLVDKVITFVDNAPQPEVSHTPKLNIVRG